MDIFGTLIARPFGWVFWAILQVINNYGIAIILFSLIVKIILYPLQYKSKKGMLAQQRLQSQIKDLEARYKNDRNAYNQALQELYTKNGISPMSGCLPMLLMFPIMIGLYRVIRQPITYVFGKGKELTSIIEGIIANNSEAAAVLQPMLENPAKIVDEIPIMRYLTEADPYYIDMTFLGMDLTVQPTLSWNVLVLLPIISGVTAYLMSYVNQKLQEKTTGVQVQMNGSSKSLLYTMPLLSVVIGFTLPAGLTVYWIANNVLGIAQEYVLQLQMRKIIRVQEEKEAAEEAVTRAQREAAMEKNREIQKQMNASGKKKQNSSKKTYKLSRPARNASDDDDD
ncbi:MAG: YidC/Oxa1 family membrane protein insertase [Clostridia bacterium]|nr:YidC/Oxa1 family membrane protein insertase [Clostridia bacterium]MBR6763318.1 YidC/Oxa1 family membrane protein insertase [Clostridia bacterium]